jgi:hypothetical protein
MKVRGRGVRFWVFEPRLKRPAQNKAADERKRAERAAERRDVAVGLAGGSGGGREGATGDRERERERESGRAAQPQPTKGSGGARDRGALIWKTKAFVARAPL